VIYKASEAFTYIGTYYPYLYLHNTGIKTICECVIILVVRYIG
jgi:hypothetical protein